MNEKTVYKELLSYKILPEDVNKIANSFIFAQKNDYKVTLGDFINLYHRKINIVAFDAILQKSKKRNLKIPFDKFKNTKLTRNDFTNLLEGWYYAAKNKVNFLFSELEFFAQSKINLIKLIDAVLLLKKADKTIELKDFVNCKSCLFKTNELVKSLINLKKTDENISLKQIIKENYTTPELDVLTNVYNQFKALKPEITLTKVIELKKRGFNIEHIAHALKIAAGNEIKLSFDKILSLSERGINVKEIANDSVIPRITELKPISTVIKSGLEILFKIKIKTIICLNNTSLSFDINMLFTEIKKELKEEVYKFDNFQHVYSNSEKIAELITGKLQKNKTIFKLLETEVADIAIGRNLILEEEIIKLKAEKQISEMKLQKLLTERKIVEEKAKIYKLESGMSTKKNDHKITHKEEHHDNNKSHNKH